MFACDAHLKNKTLDFKVFDPDVAGPGASIQTRLLSSQALTSNPSKVLAAFLTTALTALITVTVAYLTYSVPTELLNDADDLITEFVRNLLGRLFPWARFHRTIGKDARDERIETFTSFMLSASDQILVSQLAILIAALMAYETVTVYSADIILALAFLASTVHLSSFGFLAEELRQRPKITAIRILLIWCASLMLSAGLILQISDHWRGHEFVVCAARDWKIARGMSRVVLNFVPVLYVLGETFVVTWRLSGQPSKAKRKMRVVGLVAVTTGNRTPDPSARGRQMYAKTPSSPTEMELDSLDRSPGRRVEPQEETPDTPVPTARDAQQEHEEHQGHPPTSSPSHSPQRSDFTRRCISFWKTGGEPASVRSQRLTERLKYMASHLPRCVTKGPRWRRGVAHWFLATWWASAECTASFMGNILGLLFGTIYGVGSVFTARARLKSMRIDKNEMSFGQIIPIAMLVLPIIAALQSISDYQKATHNLRHNRHHKPHVRSRRAKHHGTCFEYWTESTEPTGCSTIRIYVYCYSVFLLACSVLCGIATISDNFLWMGYVFFVFFLLMPIFVKILPWAWRIHVARRHARDVNEESEQSEHMQLV